MLTDWSGWWFPEEIVGALNDKDVLLSNHDANDMQAMSACISDIEIARNFYLHSEYTTLRGRLADSDDGDQFACLTYGENPDLDVGKFEYKIADEAGAQLLG